MVYLALLHLFILFIQNGGVHVSECVQEGAYVQG